MPGPRPAPTKLKALRGNPGKRPLPKHEPVPDVAAPEPPSWLVGEALAEWNRLVPELLTLGLLTKLDRAALAAYCQTWGELDEASQPDPVELALELDPATKADALSKRAAVQRKARDQLTKFIALFGLSPADRTRIHAIPKAPKEQSPLERLRAPIR